jgi:hypothetical protein
VREYLQSVVDFCSIEELETGQTYCNGLAMAAVGTPADAKVPGGQVPVAVVKLEGVPVRTKAEGRPYMVRCAAHVLHYTAPSCTLLYCNAMSCTAPHNTPLHYSAT